MPRPTPYTPAEIEFLRANYTTASRDTIMAAIPGRSWTCVRKKAYKLHATGRPLVVPVKERTAWHPANLALLRALYPAGGSVAVMAATGLSAHSVRNQACRMKLHYVAQRLPYTPVAPRLPKAPKVANVATPRRVVALPPAKPPRVTTPNVNASMSRKRVAASKETGLSQAIARHKTLKYGQPEHTAFLRDGLLGWQRWQQQQPR